MADFPDHPALPNTGDVDGDALPPLPDLDEAQLTTDAVQMSQTVDDGDVGSATEPEDAPPPAAPGKKPRRKATETQAQTRVDRVTPHGFSILAAVKLKRPGTELLAAINANAEVAEMLAARVDSIDGSDTAASPDDADVRKMLEELDARVNALAVEARDAARASDHAAPSAEMAAMRASFNSDHAYLVRLGETVLSTHRALQQEQAKTAAVEREVSSLKTKLLLLTASGDGLPVLPTLATAAPAPGTGNRVTRPRSPSLEVVEPATVKRARVQERGAVAGSSLVCPAISFGPWRGAVGKPLHDVWSMLVDSINLLPDCRNIALPYAVMVSDKNVSFVDAVFKTTEERDTLLVEWQTAPRQSGAFVPPATAAMVQSPPPECLVTALQSSRTFRRR